MSIPANKFHPAEEEWIPELREEFDPMELQARENAVAPEPEADGPAESVPIRPTPSAVDLPPIPSAPEAIRPRPVPSDNGARQNGAQTHPEGLELHRLEAIAARIEQKLKRQLDAASVIVRIQLMRELRTQLKELYKDYGQGRHEK